MARGRWFRSLGALALAVLPLAGCDDDNAGLFGVEVDALRIEAVSGGGQEGEVGTTLAQPAVVRVTTEEGRPMPGVEVVWEVAAGDGQVSAATTTTNADGLASVTVTLGPDAGEQVVTARLTETKQVEFRAEATPGAAAQVVIEPSPITLNEGEALDVVVRARDRFGNLIPDRPVTLTITAPVANVAELPEESAEATAKARVHAVDAGSATLIAQVDNARGGTLVFVNGTAAGDGAGTGTGDGGSSGSTSPSTISVTAGQGQSGTVGQPLAEPLVIVVVNGDGTPASGVAVQFAVSSGGGSVSPVTATTGADGKAQATFTLGPAAGSQAVTASVSGLTPVVFTASAQPGAVATVTVDPSSLTLNKGQTAQLSVAARDKFGNRVDATAQFSSTNGDVASVSADGVVTAKAAGSATIHATAGGVTGSASVTVNPEPSGSVVSVTIDPSSLGLQPGETAQLKVTAKDAAGVTVSGKTVTFSSSNTAVATVSSDGVVTAQANGEAVITATVEGVSATAKVSVNETGTSTSCADVAAVTVTPAELTVKLGASATLDVTATDAAGNVVVCSDVAFSVADTAILSISADGVVVGLLPGTTTVTATVNGKADTTTVTVTL